MSKRLLGTMAVMLLTALLPVRQASAQSDREYTFGVVPQWSAQRLAEAWIPFLKKVSAESGVRLKFQTAPTLDDFYDRVSSGAYDFAYLNPLEYTRAHERQGYGAFACEANKKLAGIIVVRKDSALTKLTDLRGKTLILPGASAFAAHILNRAALSAAGLADADVAIKTVSSHDSAYLMVQSKQADAAGGVVRTLKALPDELQASLRVLNTTAGFHPHPFAAHPRVPPGAVESLRRFMLVMRSAAEQRPLLEALEMNDGFVVASDADYADSREYAKSFGKGKK